MHQELLNACLLELSSAGITVDRQLVRIASEEVLKSGDKVFTLLLDGQEFILQVGRFAYFEISLDERILSFSVLERLENSSIRKLLSDRPKNPI